MGCSHPRSGGTNFVYSVPINPPEEAVGESQIYRLPETRNGLMYTLKDDPTVTTIHDLYIRSFHRYPNFNFLGTRENLGNGKFGPYRFKTYAQVQDIATRLGSGIINLNLPSGDLSHPHGENFILIWSKNREEWLITDMSCALYRLALIPVYDTLGPETLNFIFNQTQSTTIFISNDHFNALIDDAKNCKSLKNVVTFEPATQEQLEKAEKLGLKVFTYDDVLKSGAENKQEYRKPLPDDIYTVNYTSGTTGLPKGVVITHRNQLAPVAAVDAREDVTVVPDDTYLSYLPLAHTLERTATLLFAVTGSTIGFYNGDVGKIKDDLQELKPTIFISVPRLFTRFYEKMQEGLNQLQGMKKSLATKAVETKLENLQKYGSLHHGIYDPLVFSKMKQAMGGRVRLTLTGSAPIEPEVQNFLRIATGVPMLEGYGQTETCAASFISRAEVPSFGHVGGPLACIEFKVVDVPEMNYTSKDKDAHGNLTPRGEICMRGPSAFKGYYKDPEKTKEAIDSDGWVHTGDIGRINPDGSLSIIDRKKNIFKLAQGEYVASEKVENAYLTSRYIAEAFLYGDSKKSYCVAIAVPNKYNLLELGKELGLNLSFEELCQNKEVRARVLADMTKKGKEHKINSFELAKQLHLEPKTFGENGLMTPTFKVIRHEAKNHFQKVIDDLYQLPLDVGK